MNLKQINRNLFADRHAAMTLIELLVVIVVLAIVAVLFLFHQFPRHDRWPEKVMRIQCVNNLKQVGLAFKIWAGDHNGQFPMQVSTAVTNGGTMELIPGGNVFPHFLAMSNELNDPRILVCPLDAKRRAATNFTTDFNNANISYMIGVDASETNPGAILTGDRNLELDSKPLSHGMNLVGSNSLASWSAEIHGNRGNIGLADGSVQQCNSEQLRQLFQHSGFATNRLVLP